MIVDNKQIQYCKEGKILGLHITNFGYKSHITNTYLRTKSLLSSLKSFSDATLEVKRRLYMSLIRPILTYPPVPINAASIPSIYKLQIVQNKALRFIFDVRYPEIPTNEELHINGEMIPLNIVLNRQAKEIWNKIYQLDIDNQTERIIKRNDDEVRIQSVSFRSSQDSILNDDPIPLYRR